MAAVSPMDHAHLEHFRQQMNRWQGSLIVGLVSLLVTLVGWSVIQFDTRLEKLDQRLVQTADLVGTNAKSISKLTTSLEFMLMPDSHLPGAASKESLDFVRSDLDATRARIVELEIKLRVLEGRK